MRRPLPWETRPTMKGEGGPQSQDWNMRDGTRPPAKDPWQLDKGLELTGPEERGGGVVLGGG